MSSIGGRRIGAFKPQKAAGLTADAAEALAATVLAALAADPARLARFMRDSGMGPDDLRRSAGSPDVLAGVLEHVLSDESLLLVVASETGSKPEDLAAALGVLQKPALGSP